MHFFCSQSYKAHFVSAKDNATVFFLFYRPLDTHATDKEQYKRHRLPKDHKTITKRSLESFPQKGNAMTDEFKAQ